MENDHTPPPELEPCEPTLADLVALCRWLNTAGYVRQTIDVDLLVATGADNERRVYEALSHLPDNAVRELTAGDLDQSAVIRVADEIIVDLMKSAGGIQYSEAAREITTVTVDGVPIPFASPSLLWRMKAKTYRKKTSLTGFSFASGLRTKASVHRQLESL